MIAVMIALTDKEQRVAEKRFAPILALGPNFVLLLNSTDAEDKWRLELLGWRIKNQIKSMIMMIWMRTKKGEKEEEKGKVD